MPPVCTHRVARLRSTQRVRADWPGKPPACVTAPIAPGAGRAHWDRAASELGGSGFSRVHRNPALPVVQVLNVRSFPAAGCISAPFARCRSAHDTFKNKEPAGPVDSLTQIALGAAVGEAVLGRRVGRKAALWGAVCGTLPDLDVLILFGDPVADFTFHRSFSHSVIMLALLTPLMVWLIQKIHPADAGHRKGWLILVYLAFLTHVLIDSCTIYGTQIFWPLTEYPMTWGSIFIIDPLYTLPLIAGVIAVAVSHRNPQRAHRFNLAMLALSTLYLGWSFAAKFYTQGIAREELARQGIEYRQILSLPGPFNTILWRFVVMTPNGYAEGWYSLLSSDRAVKFTHRESDVELLNGLEAHWPMTRLQWFTKGFYRVVQQDENVVIQDLRMGGGDYFAFQFKVGEIGNPHSIPTTSVQLQTTLEEGVFTELWSRLKGH